MALLHDLYFFIYPTGAAAESAARLAHSAGSGQDKQGAPMAVSRLHATLHYLGRFEAQIPAAVVKQALAAGEAMDVSPFGVAFDQLQASKLPGTVGHLELTGRGPAMRELRRLQRDLGTAMREAGCSASQIRSSFRPHITLDYAHEHVARRAIAPIAWMVSEFCLVDSHHGDGVHEVIGRWPLRERQLAFAGW